MDYQKNDIQRCQGFTLLETIFVLTILGIVSVMGVGFVVSVARQHSQIEQQSTLFINSELTWMRMHKQLREAAPHSIRVSNENRCLQFLPVVGTGFYLNTLPDLANGLPAAGDTTPLDVSPHLAFQGIHYISVGAASASELYGSNPGSLASVQNRSNTQIQLNNDKRWQRNSSDQRFYLTDRAQAYCIVDEQLRFYQDLLPSSNAVDLSSSFDLLADSVVPIGQYFSIVEAGDNCQQCVTLSLRFSARQLFWDLKQTATSRYRP